MAPSRRRAAQRVAAAAAARLKWKVGDLVLAKVKGFPAWPATVDEPKKWGYSADSKKVVVCFFGGEQIAFCNPADLEEFTEDKKATLLGKLHGKGADFSRAVNEIIQCFEKLKKQNEASIVIGSEENIDSNEINSEQSSSKPVKDEATVSAVDFPSAEATDDLNCLTEAAMGAAAEDSLQDEKRLLEVSTSLPISASDLTRIKTSFSRLISSSESRKSTLRSRNALHVDNGIENKLFPSMKSCRRRRRSGAYKLQNRNLRRSSRIMKFSDDSEGQAADSHASVSDDGSKESDSKIVSVESDTPSVNDGCGSDSDSKPMETKLLGERDVWKAEFGDRLNFQSETTIIKKKRIRSRRRNCNDRTTSAKVEVFSDAEALSSFHALPCSSEKISLSIVKEAGDEHLPLVKRARVRMARSPPSMTEKITSLHEMQKVLKDPGTCKMHCRVGKTESFLDEGPSSIKEDQANSSVARESPARESQFWDCKKNTVYGESTLPPSKRIHRALEAMSANVAEDSEKASCSSLTVSVQCSNSYPSVKECSELSIGEEFVESLSEASKDVDNHDSDLCAVLDVDTIDNSGKTFSAVSECGDIDVPKTNLEVHRESIERGEGVDIDVEMTPLCDFPSKIGVEIYSKIDSANASVKMAPSLIAYLADQCKTVGPDLKEPEQKSDSDILQMNSISNFMEEITLGPSEINSSIHIHSTDGEGDNDKCNPLCLPGKDINRSAAVSSLDPKVVLSSTPIEVLDNGCHQPLLSSISFEYIDDRTISVTQPSSSVTNRLDSSARPSPPCSSKCSTTLTDNISLDNNASQSPYSFLHPAKQPKPLSTSSSRHESLLAFESVIGTLTRTKDNIGRATRMAIDCANFGFANNVVEILMNNLERETSLHKKVNFFFLVDSITQCSRTMKGDGGIYPSVIQAVLPRLLSAAAPPCSSSLENRQQCLKVLKVWLERKILPDPIIRHHIRELEAICCTYPSVGSRLPLRNERAFDDPIRQMEGMLVDEYGSNSSIQLPGFSMPTIHSDDERDGFDCEDQHSVERNVETIVAEQTLIPSVQKRSCILEDVEGELEMEDVAPCLEDEAALAANAGADGTQMSNHHSNNVALFNPQQADDMQLTSTPSSQCPPPAGHLNPVSVFSLALPADVVDSKHISSSQNYNREYRDSMCNQSRVKLTPDAMHHRVQDNGYFEDQMPRKLPDSNTACPVSRHNLHFSGRSNDFPSNDAFSKGFHFRPSHPAYSSQFSYAQERVQSRRDIPPPYNRHRTRYPENGSFYRNRDRNKFIHRDNNYGEYWRPPYPPYNSGPCYQDGGRMNHPPSYGGSLREPPFPNNRWRCPPGLSNHRHVNHCEGPIPVENRASDYWRPR